MMKLTGSCRTALLSLVAVGALGIIGGNILRAADESKAGAKVGEPAPSFSLPDTDGKTHNLADYRGKIVIIEFDATRCPVAQAYDARMNKYIAENVVPSNGKVVWLAINSNENPLEDIAEIKTHMAKVGAQYPVLKDKNSKVADLYAAAVTPHMYVIDAEGVLRYKGAFDDNMKEDKVTKHYLADAVKALQAGTSVPVSETKAKGCSIKRP